MFRSWMKKLVDWFTRDPESPDDKLLNALKRAGVLLPILVVLFGGGMYALSLLLDQPAAGEDQTALARPQIVPEDLLGIGQDAPEEDLAPVALELLGARVSKVEANGELAGDSLNSTETTIHSAGEIVEVGLWIRNGGHSLAPNRYTSDLRLEVDVSTNQLT